MEDFLPGIPRPRLLPFSLQRAALVSLETSQSPCSAWQRDLPTEQSWPGGELPPRATPFLPPPGCTLGPSWGLTHTRGAFSGAISFVKEAGWFHALAVGFGWQDGPQSSPVPELSAHRRTSHLSLLCVLGLQVACPVRESPAKVYQRAWHTYFVFSLGLRCSE